MAAPPLPAATLPAAAALDAFQSALWPMLRISALVATAPLFSQGAFNLRLRILLALALAVMVLPLHDWPRLDPVSARGLAEIANQLALGALGGLVLQVVVGAVVLAGQAVASAMGLSMASLADPTLGNVPVVSQLLLVLAMLGFVGSGGHALVLAIVIESFHTLPVGGPLLGQAALGLVLRWSAMLFLGALLVALPVMVTLLLANVGLGVVSRAAPSLNLFSVGLPATIVAGLLVLLLFLGPMLARIDWIWLQAFGVLRELLGVQRV